MLRSRCCIKASRLLDELKAAPDAAARDKIIDDNSAVWGEIKLKQWLLCLSHQKCWFSEAMEGCPIPAAYLTDAWEIERVKYSVERYNLDFPPLMDKRKAVWAECWNRIQEYLKELTTYRADKTNVIARDRYKQALKRVRELMHEKRGLSAVARACILSSGDPRVTGILQSA